tara:strand:- start:616 stop:768 length:153 start_codon:yes stop_codon:yes gene_type:complete
MIIKVKILYKNFSSNENKPKAIPSFHIKFIFKNLDVNKLVDKFVSLFKIT